MLKKKLCDVRRGIVISENLESTILDASDSHVCQKWQQVARSTSWILADHTRWMGTCRTMFRLVCRETIFSHLTHLKYRREIARQVLSAGR